MSARRTIAVAGRISPRLRSAFRPLTRKRGAGLPSPHAARAARAALNAARHSLQLSNSAALEAFHAQWAQRPAKEAEEPELIELGGRQAGKLKELVHTWPAATASKSTQTEW